MNKFTPGQILKTVGLDMGCTEVEIDVEFVRYLDERTETGFDCIINDSGVNVLCCSIELDG